MANPSYFTSAPVTQEIQHTEFNFHLYMYQWYPGNPSANELAVVMQPESNRFGTVFANDWTIFDGPGANAKLVARGQGLHSECDMNIVNTWMVVTSIVFVDERFKGSTLKVVGSYGGHPVNEWAIVGGTGEFGFAQGVATFSTKPLGPGSSFWEFNIRVRCPILQIAPVPTLPIKEGPLGGKGGDEFAIPDQPKRLESVTIRSGDVIDSLAFSYTDQAGKKQTAGPWGGNGGLETTITFAPTETLKKVFGTTANFGGNVVVTSLTFVTDVKTYPALGKGKGTGTTNFSLPEKDASVIVGFFGRAGLFLDAIGAYVAN